ncbi:hypothetical protein HD601_005600 [Jiangella mangrovi]|uniref:Uncharacterized protein n=1 Tax=Jiangella mangrovi TaxID=1524084 RepID=A0A7W9GVW6_9ACTN|nr:hypothetical protein [Jiangella mangrovi]MBB5791025.1 hypothetical protein [Jiangella mangrovi]
MVNIYCDQARFWFIGQVQRQRLVDLGALFRRRVPQRLHDAAELVDQRRDVGHSEFVRRREALELGCRVAPLARALRQLLRQDGGALRSVLDRDDKVLDLAVQLLDPPMQGRGGRVLTAGCLLAGRQPLRVREGGDPLVQALEDHVLADVDVLGVVSDIRRDRPVRAGPAAVAIPTQPITRPRGAVLRLHLEPAETTVQQPGQWVGPLSLCTARYPRPPAPRCLVMCCAGLRWAVLSRPGVRGTTDDGADEQRVGQVESH